MLRDLNFPPCSVGKQTPRWRFPECLVAHKGAQILSGSGHEVLVNHFLRQHAEKLEPLLPRPVHKAPLCWSGRVRARGANYRWDHTPSLTPTVDPAACSRGAEARGGAEPTLDAVHRDPLVLMPGADERGAIILKKEAGRPRRHSSNVLT